MYRLIAIDKSTSYETESYHKDIRKALSEYNRLSDLTDCKLHLDYVEGERSTKIRSNDELLQN